MKSSRTESGRKHTPARRWRIPPAPLTAMAGPEGVGVLEEVGGDTGVMLWRALRRANTWTDAPPHTRHLLWFADAVDRRLAELDDERIPGDLRPPLQYLALLLAKGQSADPALLSEAAASIAEWAVSEGHTKTAAEFFEAAAKASPDSAAYALAAGRATRDLADYPRAEAWLQRAISLARKAKDWPSYISGYLAMARMMVRRGNMPAARRFGERSLRRSMREGCRELKAISLHELFVIEFECRHYDLAETYAGQALESYPDGHPTVPWLAHDIAYLRMTRGVYEDALRIFTALKPRIPSKRKPHILGAIAYAAGGSDEEEIFERAMQELSSLEINPGTAEAWLEVARGAMHLGRTTQALDAARRSSTIARERSEQKVVFEAEAFEEMCASLTETRKERVNVPQSAFTDQLVGRVVRKLATV